MGDWAEDKAREFFGVTEQTDEAAYRKVVDDLAALLREVREVCEEVRAHWATMGRDATLAEVRRVVEEEACHWDHCTEKILARLEKL